MARSRSLDSILSSLQGALVGYSYRVSTRAKYFGQPCKEDADKLCATGTLFTYYETIYDELVELGVDTTVPINSIDLSGFDEETVTVINQSIQAVEEASAFYQDEVLENSGDINSALPTIPVGYPISNLAVSQRTNNSLTITWEYTATATTTYIVEQSTDNITYQTVGETSAKTFLLDSLDSDTLYYFRVSVQEEGQFPSDPITTFAYTLLNPVTNLVGVPVSETQIDISWTDTNAGETGHRIELSTDGGTNYTFVDSVGPNVVMYSLTSLSTGSEFFFRVQAEGTTAMNPSEFTVNSASTLIAAPSDLEAINPVAGISIDLAWVDNSSSETSFELEYKLVADPTYTVVVLPPDTELFTLTNSLIAVEEDFNARVRALNASSQSAYSNVITSYIPAFDPPVSLQLDNFSSSQYDISWTSTSSGAENGFEIERSLAGAETWSLVGNTGTGVVTFTDTTIDSSLDYEYRVFTISSNNKRSIASNLLLVEGLTEIVFTTSGVTNGSSKTFEVNGGTASGYTWETPNGNTYVDQNIPTTGSDGFTGGTDQLKLIVQDTTILTDLEIVLASGEVTGDIDLSGFTGSTLQSIKSENLNITNLDISTLDYADDFVLNLKDSTCTNILQNGSAPAHTTRILVTPDQLSAYSMANSSFADATVILDAYAGTTFDFKSGDTLRQVSILNCPNLVNNTSENLEDVDFSVQGSIIRMENNTFTQTVRLPSSITGSFSSISLNGGTLRNSGDDTDLSLYSWESAIAEPGIDTEPQVLVLNLGSADDLTMPDTNATSHVFETITLIVSSRIVPGSTLSFDTIYFSPGNINETTDLLLDIDGIVNYTFNTPNKGNLGEVIFDSTNAEVTDPLDFTGFSLRRFGITINTGNFDSTGGFVLPTNTFTSPSVFTINLRNSFNIRAAEVITWITGLPNDFGYAVGDFNTFIDFRSMQFTANKVRDVLAALDSKFTQSVTGGSGFIDISSNNAPTDTIAKNSLIAKGYTVFTD